MESILRLVGRFSSGRSFGCGDWEVEISTGTVEEFSL